MEEYNLGSIEKHLCIMCKVHFIKESLKGDYKILGHLTKANYEDKNYSMNNYKQD